MAPANTGPQSLLLWCVYEGKRWDDPKTYRNHQNFTFFPYLLLAGTYCFLGVTSFFLNGQPLPPPQNLFLNEPCLSPTKVYVETRETDIVIQAGKILNAFKIVKFFFTIKDKPQCCLCSRQVQKRRLNFTNPKCKHNAMI